ncbi:Spt4-domain-containing protein [Lophiostoma macrostomum CBS 122681]|uniref:Transcription elongation factor SPT4 n=1 Tax=Lophiostoma macrostomum CBS 122681 TaxID=1314788 RepID=A0A6A6TLY0_9PLEO|nr:Spt4-domain-containing protein [Lophiostoma macrostomum CBS 122681]
MPKRGIAAVKKGPSKYLTDSSESDNEDIVVIETIGQEENRQFNAPSHLAPLPTPQRSRSRSKKNTVGGQSGFTTNDPALAQTLFGDEDLGVRESVEQDIREDGPTILQASSQAGLFPSPSQHLPDTSVHNLTPSVADLNLNPQRSHKTALVGRTVSTPKRTPKQTVDVSDLAPPETDNMSWIPPSQQRNMRACMVCSIVRTYNQFVQSGCPNCDAFLELVGNGDAVTDCTSQVFDGLLTVSDTSRSWVARHQRLEGYVPGVYAVQVEGILPDDAVVAAEQAGVHYIPRDGSVSEALPTEG